LQLRFERTVNCVTNDALPLAPAPELVFGLVGPIGVDLDTVIVLLEEALHGVGYEGTFFASPS
jgi:hypothetical protein